MVTDSLKITKRTHFLHRSGQRSKIPARRGARETRYIIPGAILFLPPSWRGDQGGSLTASINFPKRTQLMALNSATITYSEFFGRVAHPSGWVLPPSATCLWWPIPFRGREYKYRAWSMSTSTPNRRPGAPQLAVGSFAFWKAEPTSLCPIRRERRGPALRGVGLVQNSAFRKDYGI